MRELSLHILDLVQNSVAAGASLIRVAVEAKRADNTLKISIKDNGRGMAKEILEQVADPFYTTRTTRKVGMGIPLFRQAAESCGGWFKIESEPNVGTNLEAAFELNHIDRLPLGNITSTLIALIAANPDIDFEYLQSVDENEFVLDTWELKETLQDVPVNAPEVLKWIEQYVSQNIGNYLKID